MDDLSKKNKQEEINILSDKQDNIQEETDTIIQEIRNNKPFSGIIDYTNIEIHRIYKKWAQSWEVWRIVNGNNEFKLRKCKKIDTAIFIEQVSKKVGSTLPNFYGRENEYLLYKRIKKGWNRLEYNKENKSEKIGELLWRINWTKEDTSFPQDEILDKIFKRVNDGILSFSSTEQKLISEFLENFRKNPAIRIGMDLQDTKPENIVFDNEDKVYCIDEGAFKIWIKGYWIWKIIKYKDSFKPKDFLEWYKRYCDIELNKWFIEWIFLITLLKKIQQKIEVENKNFHDYNTDYSLDQKYVLDILHGTNTYIKDTSFPDLIQYIENQKIPTTQPL